MILNLHIIYHNIYSFIHIFLTRLGYMIYDMIGFCPSEISEDLQLPCHQRSARLSQLPQCSPETGGEMAKWTAGQDGDSNVFQPWGNRLCKTNKAPDSM